MSPKVVRKHLLQEIKAFMAFSTPMSSLLETSDLSSEDEGEYKEDEKIYDAQEVFNDLFYAKCGVGEEE